MRPPYRQISCAADTSCGPSLALIAAVLMMDQGEKDYLAATFRGTPTHVKQRFDARVYGIHRRLEIYQQRRKAS